MPRPNPSLLPRRPQPSWLWVLVGCLLSLTGPINLTIVMQVIDGNMDPPAVEVSMNETDHPSDDEEDMLRPSSGKERRFDRRQARSGLVWPDWRPALFSAFLPPSPPLLRPCLSGCEHAGRNGVGAPLRC